MCEVDLLQVGQGVLQPSRVLGKVVEVGSKLLLQRQKAIVDVLEGVLNQIELQFGLQSGILGSVGFVFDQHLLELGQVAEQDSRCSNRGHIVPNPASSVSLYDRS